MFLPFKITLIVGSVDTTDFAENEIRSVSKTVNFKTWNKQIPSSIPGKNEYGIRKDRKIFQYKNGQWQQKLH